MRIGLWLAILALQLGGLFHVYAPAASPASHQITAFDDGGPKPPPKP